MTDYFVKNGGNDGDTGLDDDHAWATVSKVNGSSFSGDDNIYFKKGSIWREQLTIPSSGTSGHPITFGAYGSGDNPLILGSADYDTMGQWTDISGNEWATANNSFTSTPRALWYDTDSTPVWGVRDSTPDTNWEWRYDATNDRVVLYHSTGNPADQTAGLEIGNPSHSRGIYNVDKDYITIDGIDIKFTKNEGILFYSTGCTNPIIQNCNLSYTAYYCLMLDHPVGTVTIDACTVFSNGVGDGIDVFNATAGTISNCTVTRAKKMGIDISECDSVTIEDCTVDMQESTLNSRLGSCIGGDDFNNCIIQNNELYDAYLAGVDLQGYDGANNSNIVRYNLIHDNTAGSYGHGVNISGFLTRGAGVQADSNEVYYNIIHTCDQGIRMVEKADSNTIYNNVLYNITSDKLHLTILSGTYPQNNIFKNNIVYSTTGKHLNINGFTSTNNTFDYNCYYDDHATCFTWNGSNYNTFTAYQSASSQDVNSLGNTNPQWVDPANADFHVQPHSTCIDAGVDVSLTEDYYGNAVPYNSVEDIGAHEFQGAGAGSGTASGESLLFGANF